MIPVVYGIVAVALWPVLAVIFARSDDPVPATIGGFAYAAFWPVVTPFALVALLAHKASQWMQW